jgi:hypothetical protein
MLLWLDRYRKCRLCQMTPLVLPPPPRLVFRPISSSIRKVEGTRQCGSSDLIKLLVVASSQMRYKAGEHFIPDSVGISSEDKTNGSATYSSKVSLTKGQVWDVPLAGSAKP